MKRSRCFSKLNARLRAVTAFGVFGSGPLDPSVFLRVLGEHKQFGIGTLFQLTSNEVLFRLNEHLLQYVTGGGARWIRCAGSPKFSQWPTSDQIFTQSTTLRSKMIPVEFISQE